MRVTGSQDRNFYRIMDSGAKITKGNQTYYIYMEVVTADKEHPENKGIQIIDLATKKAYNDRYFLWHSKKGIFTQEKVCEDYRTMLKTIRRDSHESNRMQKNLQCRKYH